jgi:hypothetical protein
VHQVDRVGIVRPAQLEMALAQASKRSPGLLRLPQPMMGYGQEGHTCWGKTFKATRRPSETCSAS